MTPQRYCREKVAASHSSFSLAFRFLPAAKRDAITAFYAFCREVDDIVDECREPAVARTKLDWWRTELHHLYGGQPSHPVAMALLPVIGPYGIAREQLEEIIDGMAMDLDQTRYADYRELRLYCHRVAGIVGEVAAGIFGYRDRNTIKYAARMGLAFQLTNILRDIGEDARRGRIYLPQEELARFGVAEADLLQGRDTEAFRHLAEFQYQRASATYAEALALLPADERRSQRPGLVMAAIYRAVLDEIRHQGYPVLHRHVRLPAVRKVWLAGRTWLTG
ncbi:squalene synthase HpnD [Parasulfuritortus cantonensis]|uniref:Squalene synthase HpnD n=1 Tax=Parasulfuritortus cantonensis TaxID=2528202 RepID=A0A4R1B766_9PROT|nr:presqualene diphosphate synthase HpnD [Parasulfuritortus cantonensis]TCJ11513.1 squalene synthase HpnD [Parasulfuritortus cantonensis]